MPHILKNDLLEVHIDLPYEQYNLSRFDWTGKISQVFYKGKSLTDSEILNLPEGEQAGKGFYNEFGIDQPVGFEEAEMGGWFIKIGIGALRKTKQIYLFHDTHHVMAADFEVEGSEEKLISTCESPLTNGYAYMLRKEVELQASGFIIKYFLKNTGEKVIQTSEYNHNFLQLDTAFINGEYRLSFPFELQSQSIKAGVNPNNVVEAQNQVITFKGQPQDAFFFSHLGGKKPVEAKWTLENTEKGIGISETGSFSTSKVNLWGTGHVISPELFFDIDLKPGDEVAWSRDYQVFEIS